MEERPVPPAGTDTFMHRRPSHLVRLLPGPKLLEIVNDYAFIPDPSDAATLRMPHHMIEGVYGGEIAPDISVEAADLHYFGLCHIFVGQLIITEQSLPANFESSECSLQCTYSSAQWLMCLGDFDRNPRNMHKATLET